MASRDTKCAYFENLNILKMKQDSEKLKTPLRFIWECCSAAFKIRSTISSFAVTVQNSFSGTTKDR